MRKFLFFFASTASLILADPAGAQGYLPPDAGVPFTPGYVPSCTAPGFMGRGYTAPGFMGRGYTAPGNAAPVTAQGTCGEISVRMIGVTIPGESNGLTKIGATTTGERTAPWKIGGNARIMKNNEHQITPGPIQELLVRQVEAR